MRVKEAKFSAKRKDGIDIKIFNGRREFIVSIDKKDLTYNDIENNNIYVKVYSMIRNCCAACPIIVLETGKKPEDDAEIEQLIKDIISLAKDEIKEALL